jgi:phage terminase Nu1 subunit (DNA packaging protein)
MAQEKAPVTVRIYNRFKQRTLVHGEHRSPPNAFATVPEDVAKNWMAMFPEDIVEAGVAQKELGGMGAELAEAKAKLAAAEAQLAALKEAHESGGKSKKSTKTDASSQV